MADILTNSTVFNLDISIWTGKAKLQRTDVDDSALPPEELITLGSKKIFDPVKLKRFHGIKSNAFAACNRYGVKFINGWLVDNKYVPDLSGKLTVQRVQWDDELQKFLATYQLECDDWLNQNPQWANILVNAFPRQSEIARRFNFGWQVFNVVPAPTGAIGDQTQDELDIVPTRAIEKMAREIEEVQGVYEAGKTFKAAPLRRLSGIARSLSFSSPEVDKLAELLDKIADTGSLDIAQIMLGKLSSPKELAVLCAPDSTPQDILSGIIVPPPAAPKPKPVSKPVAVDKPLPDINGLIAEAQGVLHKSVDIGQPAVVEVLEALHEPMEEKAPEAAADSNGQAVNDMMGLIDSGGLW